MDYVKTLPATGGAFVLTGALTNWAIALIVAGSVVIIAVALRKFFPINK